MSFIWLASLSVAVRIHVHDRWIPCVLHYDYCPLCDIVLIFVILCSSLFIMPDFIPGVGNWVYSCARPPSFWVCPTRGVLKLLFSAIHHIGLGTRHPDVIGGLHPMIYFGAIGFIRREPGLLIHGLAETPLKTWTFQVR